MSDPYLYPGTQVLRNRWGIRNQAALDRIERLLVTSRMVEGMPEGLLDVAHIQAIHRHLFQDIYDWAGEFRTVDMAKGGSAFHAHGRIGWGLRDVTRRLQRLGTMQGLPLRQMAGHLAEIIGDVNFVHPFREGNGRTQLQYARLIAERAGWRLEFSRLSGPEWIAASREAMRAEYGAMRACFIDAIQPMQSPTRPPEGTDLQG